MNWAKSSLARSTPANQFRSFGLTLSNSHCAPLRLDRCSPVANLVLIKPRTGKRPCLIPQSSPKKLRFRSRSKLESHISGVLAASPRANRFVMARTKTPILCRKSIRPTKPSGCSFVAASNRRTAFFAMAATASLARPFPSPQAGPNARASSHCGTVWHAVTC